MPILDRVLIVDDSRVTRMFVGRILMPHCRNVQAVEGPEDALTYLSEVERVDLVISDVHMAAGDGFALLRVLSGLSSPPAVLLITGREIGDADRRRAEQEGAIGFLRKPVRVRDILQHWEESRSRAPRRRQRRYVGSVRAMLRVQGEAHEPLADGELYDLSARGAFVTTEGPIPIGTPIELDIELGAERMMLRGSILRVQEPSWTHPGGVAVEFCDDDDGQQARIEDALARVQR